MRKIWLISIGFLSFLVTSSFFYVTELEKNQLSDFIGDYEKLIKFNEVIGFALIVFIVFFIYQIYFHKKGKFGSVLTKKIFLFISIIILIPSLINVKITNYFINKTVNQLFNPQIEELLENSFNIAEESVKYFSKDLSKKSIIAVEYLKLTGQDKDNVAELSRIRNILDVSGIGIYARSGSIENYYAGNSNVKFLNVLKSSILNSINKTGYYYEINRNTSGDYTFYYYVKYGEGKTLLICQDAPDFIKIDNTKIIQNRDLYHDLLKNRDNLKSVYTSTLIISVLFSIIVAVLLSLVFAQFLIRRIENLLHNIEQIKQGKFAKNETIKGNDELTQLVVAFDEMSESLDKMNKIEKMQKEQILIYKNDLENIINNLSLSVIVYDEKFNIKNINNITESILGISLTELIFRPVNEWGDKYKHLESFVEQIINGINASYTDWEENIVVRVKYSIKNLYIRTVKFINNGKIEYITLISDVTNLIKAKQNQAWADIAKRLAHEIKNPLTPIVLSAERIEMKLTPKLIDSDKEFLHRLINQIIIQVDDLKNMVNKFRDFANINKPTLLKINIVEFFNQFMSLYENMDFIKFNSQLGDNKQEINADSGLLRQVFHNLVKNAIESVDNKEGKQVTINLSRGKNSLNILVRDNGEGFAEVIMNNLFEPYGTTKGAKGSGLGMAIVKKIIDDHNGKIEVFNDSGANIVVKLPIIN